MQLDIIKSLADGGITIILLFAIAVLWRELKKAQEDCTRKMEAFNKRITNLYADVIRNADQINALKNPEPHTRRDLFPNRKP